MIDLVFREITCEQGTPEWLQARAGVITASKIKEIRHTLKNGEWSATAKKYAFRLAFERIAKSVLDDTYSNAYMKRGNELEEAARRLHEAEISDLIDTTGFFVSDCGRFGASPDGLIGDDCGAEYKCFLSPDELMPILINGDLSTVQDQAQMNMLATGRSTWHFFLYLPQMAAVTGKPYKLYVIKRDNAYIHEMLEQLKSFDGLIEEYKTLVASHFLPEPQEQAARQERTEEAEYAEIEF